MRRKISAIAAAATAGIHQNVTHACGTVCPATAVIERAGNLRAEQHADAVGEHHDHALGTAFHLFARHAVGVNKADDKEEIVADAVQQDAEIQQNAPSSLTPSANMA